MANNHNTPNIPLVVHVGFSGSRRLLPEAGNQSELLRQIESCMTDALQAIPEKFNLNNNFLCGVSQLAVGADTLFARVCQEAKIPQRVFLPQHFDEFVNAKGTQGSDFSESEKEQATKLFGSDHVIQQRVASSSNDRTTRFEQTNLEILNASDVIVCLLREDAKESVAGAVGMLKRAKRRNIPVLEMRVSVDNGIATTKDIWHNTEHFQAPTLPSQFNELEMVPYDANDGLPDPIEYCTPLKQFASSEANWYSKWFHRAAAIIILTHVAATIVATIGLLTHGSNHGHGEEHHDYVFPIIELSLLLLGLGFHLYLHWRHIGKSWAFVRLIAETNRSVSAVRKINCGLEYLFRLPLPSELKPVFRSINVVHLNATKSGADEQWETCRDEYLSKRIDNQLAFYDDRYLRAEKWRKCCSWMFTAFSTASVLIILSNFLGDQLREHIPHWVAGLGIIFPVIAVGAMSLSAAADLEARSETFRSTASFLREQRPKFEDAMSMNELSQLALETEERLLGETANWFSRRSYLGVA